VHSICRLSAVVREEGNALWGFRRHLGRARRESRVAIRNAKRPDVGRPFVCHCHTIALKIDGQTTCIFGTLARNVSKYAGWSQFAVDLWPREIRRRAAISADSAVKLDVKRAQACLDLVVIGPVRNALRVIGLLSHVAGLPPQSVLGAECSA
jgi:hypothetical protein